MASDLLTARHWIGGAWIDSPNRRNSINPATGEVIGTYADGGPAEASQAIRVARQAFLETDWRETVACAPRRSTKWLTDSRHA